MKKPIKKYLALLLALFMLHTGFPSLSHGAQTSFPADWGLIDITAAPYGADKTGTEDATWIIQRAIAHKIGKTDTIYFPAGTYRVTRTLEWIVDRWLACDLGEPKTLSQLQLSWSQGDSKTYYFEIEVSNDKETWTTVYANGESAHTQEFQACSFSPVSARYVRVQGYGDDSNTIVDDVDGQLALNEIKLLDEKELPLTGTFYLGNSASGTEKNTLPNLTDGNLSTSWSTAGEPFHRLSFQGEDKDNTVIRLTDNAPYFAGKSRAVIRTRNMLDDYNDAFLNHIYNLTVNTGSSNPTASGISWMVCNLGTVRDVNILSEDGQGERGLYCDGWPGPGLVKNVSVDGFNYGIDVRTNKHGMTFDNITLRNQRIYGFRNDDNGAYVNNLNSYNSVPAVYAGSRHTVVVNSRFYQNPGKPMAPAVPAAVCVKNNGGLLLQDCTVDEAYPAAVAKERVASGQHAGWTADLTDTSVREYATSSARLFDSPEAMLHLPPEEAPDYHSNDFSTWANVKDYGAAGDPTRDDTQAIQAAIDSGKSTIYFPPGNYMVSDTIFVRGGVKKLLGCMNSTINAGGVNFSPTHAPKPVFRIETGDADFIILDRLMFTNSPICIEDASEKTLVLRDGDYHSYRSTQNAGKLFLENVICDNLVLNGQKAWAKQLNAEGSGYDPLYKVTNNGGSFWCLGMKTEMCSGAIQTNGGGKTELLGGYIFCNSGTWNMPILESNDSDVCASLTQYAWHDIEFFNIVARETRNGETRELNRWDSGKIINSGITLARYSGIRSGETGNHLPEVSLTLDSGETVFTEPASFRLSTAASDPDGTVTNIAILRMDAFPDAGNNGGPVIVSNEISNLPAGCYTFYAKAVDNKGTAGYSQSIKITVRPKEETGKVLREYWGVLNGTYLSTLESHPDYPNSPALWDYPSSLSCPKDSLQRAYGIRMRGWLIPPETGEYRFWIAGNKQAALRLSTDDSLLNRKLICYAENYTAVEEWTKFPSQQSQPVTLVGGQKYYIEAIQSKENGNGGHLEVAWEGGGLEQAVIDGQYIIPWDNSVDDPAPPEDPTLLRLTPKDDTYARGGGTANQNYGDAIYMNVDGTAAFSYLKFDLSPIQDTIKSATLKLVPTKIAAPGVTHQVEYIPDDENWAESTVKWGSRPEPDPAVFSGTLLPVAVGTPAEVNVTKLVRRELVSDPGKQLSLSIRKLKGATGEVYYGTKEHLIEFSPVLEIVLGEEEEEPPELPTEYSYALENAEPVNPASFIDWGSTAAFGISNHPDTSREGNTASKKISANTQTYGTSYFFVGDTTTKSGAVYDASGYDTFRFWYKGDGNANTLSVAFRGKNDTLLAKIDLPIEAGDTSWHQAVYPCREILQPGKTLDSMVKFNLSLSKTGTAVYLDDLLFAKNQAYTLGEGTFGGLNGMLKPGIHTISGILYNNTPYKQETAVIVVGVYDAGGKLYTTKLLPIPIPEIASRFSTNVDFTGDSSYRVRIMLFDSLNTLLPLTDFLE